LYLMSRNRYPREPKPERSSWERVGSAVLRLRAKDDRRAGCPCAGIGPRSAGVHESLGRPEGTGVADWSRYVGLKAGLVLPSFNVIVGSRPTGAHCAEFDRCAGGPNAWGTLACSVVDPLSPPAVLEASLAYATGSARHRRGWVTSPFTFSIDCLAQCQT